MTHPTTAAQEETIAAIGRAGPAGVTTAELALALAIAEPTTRDRCLRLERGGKIERVAGTRPARWRPASSSAPRHGRDTLELWIARMGGMPEIGMALGITPSAVEGWEAAGVPERHAARLRAAYAGAEAEARLDAAFAAAATGESILYWSGHLARDRASPKSVGRRISARAAAAWAVRHAARADFVQRRLGIDLYDYLAIKRRTPLNAAA